jgi:hypothetical protein
MRAPVHELFVSENASAHDPFYLCAHVLSLCDVVTLLRAAQLQ